MALCSGLFSRPGKYDAKFFVAYLISFFFLSLMYTYTLQGGDVKFVTDRLALFAGIMILVTISTLLLTTFAITNFTEVNILTKLITLSLSWWIFLDAALQDMNTTLESHGQYNFLMFALLFCVGFALFALIKSCQFIKKRLTDCQFWGGILLLISFFTIFWLEGSRQAKARWNEGISGAKLEYIWEGCNITMDGNPWVEVIPEKTFNFYMSESCSSIEKFSSFKDGVLTVKCNEKQATIIELPDFLKDHTNAFILEENGLQKWKEITKAQEKKYKVPGNTKVNITSEYFQVFCGENENYYMQHVPKKSVQERLKKEDREKINLLIFQIDTLSRSHFMRRMKSTVKRLEEIKETKEFEVFQSFRLSTIGYNTEVNTKALYTGAQFRQSRSGRPLWDIFQKQNNAVLYLNGFCEDWSSRFLKKMPSGMDYLLFQPWCHPEYTPVNKTFSNFDGVNSMRRRCINGKKVHVRMFEYLKQFWSNHESDGKMVLAPMQESHEASMDVISTLDPDMADLLDWFKISGEMNNTIIIITSDHGSHMSLYYIFSEIGKLEHRLPEMFMIFPQWFLDKYPHISRNMKFNEQPLISHYDTHWAIASLAQLPEFGGHPELLSNNEYISVWDCRKNEKYIKDIWYFRNKLFYNLDAIENFEKLTEKVLFKMKECINKYSYEEPDEDPMIHLTKDMKKVDLVNVPPCESKKCLEVNVYDVIKDVDSYYWFVDAIVDLAEMEAMNIESKDIVYEYSVDIDVLQSFIAPGIGRYKYGNSLFHYSSNKTCADIGTKNWCACS